jgi:hypothetical protein
MTTAVKSVRAFLARTLPWFNFAAFVALASVAIVVAIIFLGLTVLDRSIF